MSSGDDSIDWSKYPPDRVEGLKCFYKGPSEEEDGPCTEDELKMLCTKWDCRVNMKVDNFLYWLMKKTKERDYKGDHELFVSKMPRMTRELRKRGLEIYEKYQEDYGEKNRKYMAYCADWRINELRRLRWLGKLRTLSSTWSWDGYSDDESESEAESSSLMKQDEILFCDSNASIVTMIDSAFRFNPYLETESVVGIEVEGSDIEHIGREEEVAQDSVEIEIESVNSQTFLPKTTSTQQE